ncbi:hypothetical protein LOK49_LG11G02828 [Camellia lanceoleosa]|uniref:Uncharacterized protein n=1 Tax=Camellia lanceoleosa TaxID=1840588 RepID=A0ACC0FZ36_9ERIC|nr:hypothetical protein LOK49_LG11G02828 [Camellia lanceoleosa]
MVSCCITYKNLKSDPLPSTSRHDAVSDTSMLSFDPSIDVLRVEDGNQEHTHQLKRMRLIKASASDSQVDIRMSRVSAEILGKFIHAAHINTHNPLVLVRITTSWALANICDSPSLFEGGVASYLIVLLIECSLQLTKDSDKFINFCCKWCLDMTGLQVVCWYMTG